MTLEELLEEHDGMCLDNAEERALLAASIRTLREEPVHPAKYRDYSVRKGDIILLENEDSCLSIDRRSGQTLSCSEAGVHAGYVEVCVDICMMERATKWHESLK